MASILKSGTTLDQVPNGARVLVVRLRSMGDCVLSTPALDLLKNARPDLEIGVVVEDRFAAVFEGNPSISSLLGPKYIQVALWHPWLCIDFHGGSRSQMLTLASLARVKAGFEHHRRSSIYDVKIPRAQEILSDERMIHTAEHLATAMFHLGVPFGEVPPARLFAELLPAARPYAVIHPAAAMPYKTWHPEGFVAVAEHLERALGLEPVFIGATTDNLKPFSGYRVVAGAPLARLKSLLAGATLFVGNDSGPAHVACALGTPVVVLFGRLEHQIIWAPWRAVAAKTLASPEGISGIKTGQVLAAIDELSDGGAL